ncbi:hypothetical protein AB9N12_19045 [Bacteroides sp. AN502(2024)]|uniref:hypothetical protein n=1 Tax=Bacteroides sp. AN502(2024) TaxID=3160599 RepID=UPI003515B3C9
MTFFSNRRKNRWQFHFGCFFLIVATLFSPRLCHHVSAQESNLKDGAVLYSMGLGYEWMSDAYSSKGFALDVRTRFYMSGRLFCELMGHWGTHDGSRSVLQKGSPFDISDERNTLLGAVGPGYEIFQSENQTFDIYIKGLVGYGIRSSRFDDYQITGDEDGQVTLGRNERKKGIAAVAGLGMDTRFKRWTLTPSVEVFYIGNEWNVATMISFGFFL